MKIITFTLVLLVIVSIDFTAHAADPADASNALTLVKDDEGIFTASLENDVFSNEDNNYTNGVRFGYFSPEDSVPKWLEDFADFVPIMNGTGYQRWFVAAGQNMYTPSDITVNAEQIDDRPYAGLVYGTIGVVSDTDHTLDTLELTLGMVGPVSGAAQTQDFVHDLIGSDDPQGWEYQLKNEPVFALSYDRKWRNLVQFSPFGFGADITPSAGVTLGNLYTHAAVGAVARIGVDLPSDYGPPLIRPNLSGSDFFNPHQNFSWYLFAGLEGRAVARNIFLDGNTFKQSNAVDKRLFVGGVQAGAAIVWGRTRLAYTHIFRTREFEKQPENDAYGALTLSRRF